MEIQKLGEGVGEMRVTTNNLSDTVRFVFFPALPSLLFFSLVAPSTSFNPPLQPTCKCHCMLTCFIRC